MVVSCIASDDQISILDITLLTPAQTVPSNVLKHAARSKSTFAHLSSRLPCSVTIDALHVPLTPSSLN